MFRTKRLSEDTDAEYIYFYLLRTFGEQIAKKIMRILLGDRKYNIQLLGSTAAGKSCFVKTLFGQYNLTNTFNPPYIAGAIRPASIAFPTSLGKVVFNIRECRHTMYDANLDSLVRQEWENTDAFFVMFQHGHIISFNECDVWINNIRRVLNRDDIPIVLVELKCDVLGRNDLRTDIGQLCVSHNIQSVKVSSRAGVNIHFPFLALQDILRTSLDRNTVDVPNIPITPLLLPPPPPPPPSQPDDEE